MTGTRFDKICQRKKNSFLGGGMFPEKNGMCLCVSDNAKACLYDLP